MLKKTSIVVIVLLSTLLFCNIAHAQRDYIHFTITIQNDSANDCVLKKQQIIYGSLLQNTSVPETLFRGQSYQISMERHGFYKEASDWYYGDVPDAMIVVTYQCGENENITLLSHLATYSDYYRARTIRGLILEKNNLNATFETKPCDQLYGNNPSRIDWIITPWICTH